jgi:hypothetical protein
MFRQTLFNRYPRSALTISFIILMLLISFGLIALSNSYSL